ncbi:hypothetical protein OK016_05695 [Vibrio chagasii]|nr:hypothetical protein [Vibrio chagasii]
MFYNSPEYNRVNKFRPNGTFTAQDTMFTCVMMRLGDYWSISWQPVAKSLDEANYEVRHGLSYSKFKCTSGITATKRYSYLKVKMQKFGTLLKNNTDKPRTISTFSFVEFVQPHPIRQPKTTRQPLYSAGTFYQEGVLEYDLVLQHQRLLKVFYFTKSTFSPDSYDGQRDNFLGMYRDEANPIAVENL